MLGLGFFGIGTAAQDDQSDQQKTQERRITAETTALVFHFCICSVSTSSTGNAKDAVTCSINY
jgi:hypothetical protein